jgi:hypothetical protein
MPNSRPALRIPKTCDDPAVLCGACREMERGSRPPVVGWNETLEGLALRMRVLQLREEGHRGGRDRQAETARGWLALMRAMRAEPRC